jgi:uncharacterized protein (TIGR02145 family)
MRKHSVQYLLSRSFIISLLMVAGSFLLLTGCKDDDEKPKPKPEFGTMTDIDGNVYKTVKIGGKWWMAENLKVTKFRDGSAIPSASSESSWLQALSAYCVYDNSSNAPGLLYNWNAVNDAAGLAPAGWRIPTDEDWKELERNLGISGSTADKTGWRGTDEGEKMKLEANTGWSFYEGIWASNESGFSAEAGSCRMFTGVFGSPGLTYTGFWWSASEHNQDEAWYRHLDYKEKGVFRYHGQKKYGFSVRCVMN